MRNESKYKSFIGRVFILRKHKKIPVHLQHSNERVFFSYKEIGEAVLILDETNSKVKVYTIENKVIWIQKFYLLKELKSSINTTVDNLVEIIQDLSKIMEKLQEQNNDCAENIKNIIVSLRSAADKTTLKK